MCESAGAVHAARTASVLAASRRHVRVCQGGKDDSLLTKQWELQRDGSFQRADMDKLVSLQLWQKIKSAPGRAFSSTVAYLLPHGYPNTVAPSYAHYASWTSLGMMFSSVTSVLSTQALLYAVGLGAGSIPVAAALNWVIKDGLGQLGGVLSAALINNRFDADPKKWRYTSAMLLDISTLLEILTPLAPAAFVPLGALANVGKNISWLAASATRAGMHQTLAINGNLADVTAKAGSQTIAASTAGTVIGVALSPLIGSGATNILIAFLVLSFLHQLCVHLGLQRMVLPTLSAMRLASATAPLYSAIAPLAATPAAFSSDAAAAILREARLQVHTPLHVSKQEVFSPWTRVADIFRRRRNTPVTQSYQRLHDGAHAPLHACAVDARECVHYIHVCPSLGSVRHFSDFFAASDTLASKYLVTVQRGPRGKCTPAPDCGLRRDAAVNAEVMLLFSHEAAWRDVIIGYLHALHVAQAVLTEARRAAHSGEEQQLVSSAVQDGVPGLERDVAMVAGARAFVVAYGDMLLQELETAGWWVGQPLIEQDVTKRFTLLSDQLSGTPSVAGGAEVGAGSGLTAHTSVTVTPVV